MIDSKHPIRIAGNLFRIDESAEGAGYIRQGETLRPPNAVQVQGETQAKFQMRPDTLVWSITDWSGGEGFRKFDPQNPNRHWRLTNVDAFSLPGMLSPGPAETSAHNTTPADLTDSIRMIGTDTRGELWGLAINASGNLVGWKNDEGIEFLAPAGVSYLNVDFLHDAVMVGDYIFAALDTDTPQANLVRFDLEDTSSSTWVASTSITDGVVRRLGALGLNVYLAAQGKVYEISATDTEEETLIDDQNALLGNDIEIVEVVSSRNRVYVIWTGQEETIIREITPSTAAGAGFGEELVRFGGLRAQSAWVQGDFLFVSGLLQGESTIMYISLVDRTYGTLGKVQQEPSGIPTFIPRLFEGGSTQPSFLETFAYFGWQGDVTEGGEEVFTVSGTFTVPAGVTEVRIEATGGGGSGAGGLASPSTDLYSGGGGGGGGGTAVLVLGVNPADELDITVATPKGGGAGGTNESPGHGSPGDDTVVLDNADVEVLRAEGGNGGLRRAVSGAGSATGGSGGAAGNNGFSGGDGGRGVTTSTTGEKATGGGGAGGSASFASSGGDGTDGTNGSHLNNGLEGHGGSGQASGGDGGSGETGGNQCCGSIHGQGGGAPGAGGGGGGSVSCCDGLLLAGDGGLGQRGEVRITWGTSVSAPGNTGDTSIYVIDSVSGGMAQWAPAFDTAGARAYPFLYKDRVYYVGADSETNPTRVVLARRDDTPAVTSSATTPIWDFALQDRKVLTSFRIHTAPLPADWTVAIEYQLDESGTWISAGSIQGEGVTGGTILVAGSPKFRSLQVRIKFTYTGSGTSDRPSLHGVEARATVALPIRIWRLSLDAFDSFGGGSQSERGTTKASEIETAYLNGSVIELDDGYESAEAGVYTTHNVVVDSFQRIVSRPGEGNIQVELREVI